MKIVGLSFLPKGYYHGYKKAKFRLSRTSQAEILKSFVQGTWYRSLFGLRVKQQNIPTQERFAHTKSDSNILATVEKADRVDFFEEGLLYICGVSSRLK